MTMPGGRGKERASSSRGRTNSSPPRPPATVRARSATGCQGQASQPTAAPSGAGRRGTSGSYRDITLGVFALPQRLERDIVGDRHTPPHAVITRSRSCLVAIARLAVPSSRPALLDFVHLSSQRTLVPVRQDGCFAEKQEPHPALLLIVLGERVAGTVADTRIRGRAGAGDCRLGGSGTGLQSCGPAPDLSGILASRTSAARGAMHAQGCVGGRVREIGVDPPR
jgi:hypothetical protein